MDAIQFLKGKKRMCKTISNCAECPLNEKAFARSTVCGNEIHYPEEAVSIVEQWSKDHPQKTNGDKFAEVFIGENRIADRIVKMSFYDSIRGSEWWGAPYKAPKEAEE